MKNMRGYNCYFKVKLKNIDFLFSSTNISCWAGLNNLYISKKHQIPEIQEKLNKINLVIPGIFNGYNTEWLAFNINELKEHLENGSIYIEDYETITSNYIPLLIEYINKITPCEIVKIQDKSFIKYKLIENYDNNLILLNFIRNLWHSPIKDYSTLFFENLKMSNKEDALEALTESNKLACKKLEIRNSPGHSNVHDYDLLKIKKTEELFKYKGNTTKGFLIT